MYIVIEFLGVGEEVWWMEKKEHNMEVENYVLFGEQAQDAASQITWRTALKTK